MLILMHSLIIYIIYTDKIFVFSSKWTWIMNTTIIPKYSFELLILKKKKKKNLIDILEYKNEKYLKSQYIQAHITMLNIYHIYRLF